MNTRIKKLKHYENSDAKLEKEEKKEENNNFPREEHLEFHRRLMLFARQDGNVIVKVSKRCVIL